MVGSDLIKTLRDRTGVGMMDCKKALAENDGDLEKAVEWLRKKGFASAGKKAERVASQGLVAVRISDDHSYGTIVEVNSETDFVARNEVFQKLVVNIADLSLSHDNLESLAKANYPTTSHSVEQEVASHIAIIGENLKLRRMGRLNVRKGAVGSYVHNSVTNAVGQIAVLVAMESDTSNKIGLLELGKKVAMHIAAMKPYVVTISQVSPEDVARERSIYIEQAVASGKPAAVAEKMVEGRIKKYYEDIVLLEQGYIFDNKMKVGEALEQAGKELGSKVSITGFICYILGAGVEN